MVAPKYKNRRTEVVLPNEEMLQKWRANAKKAKKPLSKHIVEVYNEKMLEDLDDGLPSRSSLNRNIENLEKQNADYENDIKRYKDDIERLQRDIERYRAEAHLNPNFDGVKDYHKKMVKLFEEKKSIQKIELLGLLGIQSSDKNYIDAINIQLDVLISSGLLIEYPDKWSWRYWKKMSK